MRKKWRLDLIRWGVFDCGEDAPCLDQAFSLVGVARGLCHSEELDYSGPKRAMITPMAGAGGKLSAYGNGCGT